MKDIGIKLLELCKFVKLLTLFLNFIIKLEILELNI